MRVPAPLRLLLDRFVHATARPLGKSFSDLILAAAILIVKWGSGWERTRKHGQAADDAARRFASEAWQRIQSNDWRYARYFAEAAIAADPRYADGYRMLAHAYDGAGDRTAAQDVCERGLRMAPDNSWLLEELGSLEARAQRLTAAEAPWRKAMELRPNEPRIIKNLAWLLESQRRWREALPLLERVRELEPGNNAFLVRLARVRVNTGALHDGEELLRAVIVSEPSLADAHYWLAISMAGMNRWDQAIQEAGLAVQLAPDDEHYRKIYDLFHATGGKDLVIKLDDSPLIR